MAEYVHRAKSLLGFVETPDTIIELGRQIKQNDWEEVAIDLGFTPDNYYTPAGKMFSEKLIAYHDGRLCGTFLSILGFRTP